MQLNPAWGQRATNVTNQIIFVFLYVAQDITKHNLIYLNILIDNYDHFSEDNITKIA